MTKVKLDNSSPYSTTQAENMNTQLEEINLKQLVTPEQLIPIKHSLLNILSGGISISDDILEVGDIVELTGDIVRLEVTETELLFTVNPSETEPFNVFPKIKKCSTRSKKYCGVVSSVFNEFNGLKCVRCYQFTTLPCLVKVNDVTKYNVGDTLLSDLSVIGNEEMITPLKMSCIVGKVSKIINQNYLAIFKA